MIKENKVIIIDDFISVADLVNEQPSLMIPFSGDGDRKVYMINNEYELRGEHFIVTDLDNSLIGYNYMHFYLLISSHSKADNFDVYFDKDLLTNGVSWIGYHNKKSLYNVKIHKEALRLTNSIMTVTTNNRLTSFVVDENTLLIPL